MRVLLVAVSVLACQPIPVMDPRNDPYAPDPYEPDFDESTACAATCAEYKRLECEEGEPTEGGGSCEDVCENAARSGWALAKDGECLERAQTCDAARACPKAE